MHLHLGFGRLHRMSLKRFILSLLLSATACAVSAVDSQFDVVAKRKLFVDRSLLLEYLFEKLRIHPWLADHQVIIGARKSGKSTNLSMMKQFFGVCVDESGRVLAPNTTKHYALFKRLKIGQRSLFFEQCFARIPVIYVNLAKFVVNGSEEDFKKSLCKVIHDLMAEHKYLFQSKNTVNYRKTYGDLETCIKKGTFELTRFGKNLARLVHAHFGTRALVLIDEIDAPAMSILDPNVTSVSKDFIGHAFQFVTMMIEDNTREVMGSFLTGATLQGVYLGNMCVFQQYAFETELKYFYGVTEDEVRRLLSISGIPVTNTLMQELREMYGGYGVTNEDSKEFVYNTQSIIKFCDAKVMKPYWDAAPGIAPFKKLLSSNQHDCWLEGAMYSELAILTVSGPSEKQLFEVKDFLIGKNETPPFAAWHAEGYLWESGVFSSCPREKSIYRSPWFVKVPNNENRLILLDLVLNKDYYKAKHGVIEKHVHDFVISVAKLNANKTSFSQLAESISNLFVKGTQDLDDEAVFRYPLYNYLRQDDEGLFSKVTAELGRKTQRKSDIIVTLEDGSKVFMGLTLDKESGQDALKQVLEDEQLQEFSKKKNNKFICLGINLRISDSWCDVSYLFSSTNIKDSQSVRRRYLNGLDQKSKRV